MGLTLVVVSFLVQSSDCKNYIGEFDISVVMRILILLLFIAGVFYLILIDTSFFNVKPLNALINREINNVVFKELDRQLEKELEQNRKTVLHKEMQYKCNNGKFILKPLKQIINVVETFEIRLFPHSLNIDIIKVFASKGSATKIPIDIKSSKNKSKVLPIFDFFDEIVEGGILYLCDKSKTQLFNFILDNFSKNGEEFIYRNLQNRYNVWKSRKGVNAFTVYP